MKASLKLLWAQAVTRPSGPSLASSAPVSPPASDLPSSRHTHTQKKKAFLSPPSFPGEVGDAV